MISFSLIIIVLAAIRGGNLFEILPSQSTSGTVYVSQTEEAHDVFGGPQGYPEGVQAQKGPREGYESLPTH